MGSHKQDRATSCQCTRCGKNSPECRTLRVNCGYQMDVADIPWNREVFLQADVIDLYKIKDATSLTDSEGTSFNIAPGQVMSKGPLTPFAFYTMQVCKKCRSDLLGLLQLWIDHPKSDYNDNWRFKKEKPS